jgi:hypothetical protein
MHLYAPSNHVENLSNEVIHTHIQMTRLFGCRKEIRTCIIIWTLVYDCNSLYFKNGCETISGHHLLQERLLE